ncbi:MAG: TIGR00366 family protein [Desulfovibrio sp.]|jgi:Na+/H+ antiporter NhaC|nr:TIGR00366 family protein [Desulfovibrio sp.]
MKNELRMRGGILGGLVPLIILVCGLIWLSVAERGGTKPFWACAWIAIAAGILFAKEPKEYCRALMRGIGDRTGIVIVTAWLFAGVFGELMKAGGLVNGLLWMGMTTGAQGSVFVSMVFFAAMLFSLGTGTSTGTCIALSPVLYPAGIFLGADPAMLALAILSGAAFGDNLAPVSDTTIVSAYTQGATMRDVVRSRFPLSISAALVAAVFFATMGGGGQLSSLPEIKAQLDPTGLVMLLSLVIVVVTALCGRHIIEALIYGNISAALLGLLTGRISPGGLFNIPEKRGLSTGIIENGVNSVVGAIIFAILILAVTQVLVESGIMRRILEMAEKTAV